MTKKGKKPGLAEKGNEQHKRLIDKGKGQHNKLIEEGHKQITPPEKVL